MAEKKNRRASVQLNVRLEPAEAALIKRVIPKCSLRAITVSLLVEHARQLEAQVPTIRRAGKTVGGGAQLRAARAAPPTGPVPARDHVRRRCQGAAAVFEAA
jgi:hypothetical protein